MPEAAAQPAPRPTLEAEAFAARCLLRAARAATLATQSGGQPYASLVTPATLPDASVLILISALAQHTRHLLAEPRCALMVTGAPADPVNPQTAARLTLTARAERTDDPALRRYWVDRHPYAFYAGFTDFSLWRLAPESGHFVAGFARAQLIPARHLQPPAPACAALEAAAASLCAALSGPVLNQITQAQAMPGSWQSLGVDTDGLDVIQDQNVARIAFDAAAHTVAEAEAALRRLAKQAS